MTVRFQIAAALVATGLLSAVVLMTPRPEREGPPAASWKPGPIPVRRSHPLAAAEKPQSARARPAKQGQARATTPDRQVIVSGVVIHADGSPAAGTHVWLWTKGRVLSEAHAGPDGVFELPPVAPGEYVITAYLAKTTLIREQRLTILGQTPSLRCDLRLPAQVVYRGSVLNVDGDPVRGARVAVYCYLRRGLTWGESHLTGLVVRETLTDDDGSFEITGLGYDPTDATGTSAFSCTVTAGHASYEMKPLTIALGPLLAQGDHTLVLEAINRWRD